MRAGLLNEPIRVIRYVSQQNEYGSTDSQWVDYIKTKARLIHTSGNVMVENSEVVINHNIMLELRIYHKITEDMRIVFRGKVYAIRSILPNRETQSQKISVELVNE